MQRSHLERPRSAAPVRAVLLVFALGACDGATSPSDAGIDAPRMPIDARLPITPYDGHYRFDGGPIVVDAGPCEEWSGIEEGAPITGATPGAWMWVDFPEAHCMNGSSTGLGINLSPTGSRSVVIYLEGGGACFNHATCEGVLGRDGFDRERFERVTDLLDFYAIFRRNRAGNPVRDWNFVYVPYCTGDVHAGTRVDGFEGREQVGYHNLGHFLARLVPTFRSADRVLLTGASAGGFGALANFDRVQQAFRCTPVYLLNDSGPVMDDPWMRPCLQRLTRELWGMPVPADCPQCNAPDGGGLVALWEYLARKYPDRRLALLTTTGDSTIRHFFGYGLSEGCDDLVQMPADLFEEGVIDLRDRVFAPHANLHAFVWRSEAHTFLLLDLSRQTSEGVSVGEFIRRMVEDDPAWATTGP